MKGSERRNKGRKAFAVWSLCEVDRRKSQVCLVETPRGFGAQIKGMC